MWLIRETQPDLRRFHTDPSGHNWLMIAWGQPFMSDAKASEKGDRQDRAPDQVRAPDAQEARVAGAGDMASIEKQRTNASDGSLRKFSSEQIAAQEHSIELVMPKKDGSFELLAARVMTQESNKVASDRPPEPKPPRPSDWEDQMNTGAIISAEAKKNPAVEPVALLKNWAEKLPDGAEKQAYKQLAREQLSQVSPEAKQKLDAMDERRRLIAQSNQDEAGSFNIKELREQALKGRVEEQKIIPEKEWQVLKNYRRGISTSLPWPLMKHREPVSYRLKNNQKKFVYEQDKPISILQ